MKNLNNMYVEELSTNELISFNGGSFGKELGSAAARTVGNLLGCAKLVVDAFGEVVKGKMFESMLK